VTTHFKEFGGLWPPHCIQSSEGARFHPALKLPEDVKVVSKGMDPGKDAVWIYRIDHFTDPPTAFFTGDPPDLQNTLDLAIQKDDLYLLGADGQVTLCTFSGLSVSATQCNPVPYTDVAPARGLLVFKRPSPG
jgi:hypothetical protein